ncbi:hypothetical protein CRV12_00110 [Candidatus Pantoea edessiphila]|uniref:UPF0250 protein CRV12_00110 n=1 Tax=Candidatus Pantoea edessiphila TaxID=2044610 RepID=A0A2P5T0B4_9GAMM|nr:DUF493 family protein YbeD [Candidatus Pantoea edessiphila]PPI88038.1 hypothetical protein CRV12_00110 [Candidatus Pantoea edessiphila]
MKTNFINLINFPTQFTYKIIGLSKPNLVDDIIKTIKLYCSDYYKIKIYHSRKGNYTSVNITIIANDINQIENIYNALGKIKMVRFVL